MTFSALSWHLYFGFHIKKGREQIFSESEDKKSQFWSKEKAVAIPPLPAKEGSAVEKCLKSPGGSLTKEGL